MRSDIVAALAVTIGEAIMIATVDMDAKRHPDGNMAKGVRVPAMGPRTSMSAIGKVQAMPVPEATDGRLVLKGTMDDAGRARTEAMPSEIGGMKTAAGGNVLETRCARGSATKKPSGAGARTNIAAEAPGAIHVPMIGSARTFATALATTPVSMLLI
jgi:hypothetical protein